jgi:hypothetical protein
MGYLKAATFWGFKANPLARFKRLDLVYAALVILAVLVASQVNGAVKASKDVSVCLAPVDPSHSDVPSCAFDVVLQKGSDAGVALGVLRVTASVKSQANTHTDQWCRLLRGTYRVYDARSAWSSMKQAIWISDAELLELQAGRAVCAVRTAN